MYSVDGILSSTSVLLFCIKTHDGLVPRLPSNRRLNSFRNQKGSKWYFVVKNVLQVKKKSKFCIFFLIEFGFSSGLLGDSGIKTWRCIHKLDIRNQFFILNWRWDCCHALLEHWSDAGFTEKRHLTNSCCLTKNAALKSNNKNWCLWMRIMCTSGGQVYMWTAGLVRYLPL